MDAAPVMVIVGHCGRYEANRSIALEFVDFGFVRRCEFQPSRFFIFCTVDHCGFGVHDLWGTLPAPTSAAWMPLHHGYYYSGHACCGTSIFDEEIVYDAQQAGFTGRGGRVLCGFRSSLAPRQ